MCKLKKRDSKSLKYFLKKFSSISYLKFLFLKINQFHNSIENFFLNFFVRLKK